MEFLSYITENALILIPVLVILGMIIKKLKSIPDKFIPLILLVFGIFGAFGIGLPLGTLAIDCIIQGVLVTGAAVYGNQIWKQLNKDE